MSRLDDDTKSANAPTVLNDNDNVNYTYDPNNHQLVSTLSGSNVQVLYEVIGPTGEQVGSSIMVNVQPADLPATDEPGQQIKGLVKGKVKQAEEDEEEEVDEEEDEEDEQEQRDANECFGFKDDEDEDDEDEDDDEDEAICPDVSATTKTGRGGHICNYCTYTTHKRYLLSRHMKSHSEDRPHRCGICERGFKTAASLQNHVNTHSGVRPHSCKLCDAQFTTSGELVRHIRYKHTHEKPHKCTECDYASVELSKLKRHMRCHTGERPYQCQHCTYASPDTYKLKRHLRIHTGEKPYECNVCKARFTQSNSLKAHKLIHSGNKPVYRCDKCPATCGRKTDLRIHVQKLHTADKPLTCKRCDKTYPDRYQFKLHLKTHEGEKCFKCELCAYSSISARHLESHMLIHTDKKPFACDQCEQSFRQKQLLKRHKNLYHNPTYIAPTPREKTHECHVCQKAFRHKGNLMRHLISHDPDAKSSNASDSRMEDEDESSNASTVLNDNDTVNYSYDPNNHQLVSSLSGSGDQLLYEVIGPSGEQVGSSLMANVQPADLPPSEEFEAQAKGRIKEEKQRDVSECFGFKDDDEEDEAILSMPSNALI